MIACPAFEDRLLEYRELAPLDRQDVNEHLAGCTACREYLDTLEDVDATFSSQLRGMRLGAHRLDGIRERISSDIPVGRVTTLPEWLDFAAAGAICAFGYTFAWQTGVFAYVVMALFSD